MSRTQQSQRLPDVLDFMQVLWRVVHGLDRASKRLAAETGITGPQRLVLRILGLRPGISASELAAVLHVHPSTITGVLRRLERQKLIARHSHADDRRRAVLVLTAVGRRINRPRAGTAEAAVAEVLRRLDAADRDCTRRALDAIADRLARGRRD
jgi:DNA-binding MarR family transcriptional regulator